MQRESLHVQRLSRGGAAVQPNQPITWRGPPKMQESPQRTANYNSTLQKQQGAPCNLWRPWRISCSLFSSYFWHRSSVFFSSRLKIFKHPHRIPRLSQRTRWYSEIPDVTFYFAHKHTAKRNVSRQCLSSGADAAPNCDCKSWCALPSFTTNCKFTLTDCDCRLSNWSKCWFDECLLTKKKKMPRFNLSLQRWIADKRIQNELFVQQPLYLESLLIVI